MQTTVEDTLAEIERSLREDFPGVRLEFASQSFAKHVEVWVYILDVAQYERVRDACNRLSDEQGLERRDPEVWLLAKAWTGPWPGGESEPEIRRRREEFRQRHALTLGSGR